MNNKLHNPFLFGYVFSDPHLWPRRVTHDLTDVTAGDPCPLSRLLSAPLVSSTNVSPLFVTLHTFSIYMEILDILRSARVIGKSDSSSGT